MSITQGKDTVLKNPEVLMTLDLKHDQEYHKGDILYCNTRFYRFIEHQTDVYCTDSLGYRTYLNLEDIQGYIPIQDHPELLL